MSSLERYLLGAKRDSTLFDKYSLLIANGHFKAQGSLSNIVPVIYWNMNSDSRSLDTLSSELVSLIRYSMNRFDEASSTLHMLTIGDPEAQKGVESLTQWCRNSVTGILHWSLDSHRYGMVECLNTDGSLDILL